MSATEIAINALNLSKCYRIGVKDQIHDTFGKTIIDFVKNPINNYRKYRSLYKFDDLISGYELNGEVPDDILWALKNISFQVKKGEVVGIIGANGAGKSTLLKILSKITIPTKGRAEICGRISSLLEVGTGFHNELTGRENVYLNGTILGMRKKEIDAKFDEIVDFSGIEKFIDTPVKRYSNGMKVRLAFSVAAHLDPEILVIDEVLAVGDADFQKKCLKKMEDVGQYGRTVLFVSHSMPAITRLCPRTILLDDGCLISDGPSSEVVSSYLSVGKGTSALKEWPDLKKAPTGDVARLRAVRVRNEDGHISDSFDIRRPVTVEMEYEVLDGGYILMPHFHFFDSEGLHVFSSLDQDPAWRRKPRPKGNYCSIAKIPGNLLSEGMLYVTAGMVTLMPTLFQFKAPDAVSFNVVDAQEGDSARGDWTKHMAGAFRPLLKWQTDYHPFDSNRQVVHHGRS